MQKVGITNTHPLTRSSMAQNLAALARAVEAAGVDFIDPNGGGAGVRLREPLP